MLDGQVVETLGELPLGLSSKLRIHVTDNPEFPLKLRRVGFQILSAPICADGVVPFIEALLDAAEYSGPPPSRLRPRRLALIVCSTWFRAITHKIYWTANPDRPVLVVHRKRSTRWTYRLTTTDAIWMANLISNGFQAEPISRY